MLFNSFSFLIFLPIVFALYWLIPQKFRWVVLLISSYYFYMSWNPKYVLLILFETVISYFAAIAIETLKAQKHKQYIMILTAVSILGLLFVFKYFNFAMDTVATVFRKLSIELNPITLKLLLPVGISFYTFQTLSYVIDVYRGTMTAERHFGQYATFISFFPQLVAGPIERAKNLLPQIKSDKTFDYSLASYGIKLMAWGFFKKIVIADTLSIYTAKVCNKPLNYTGFALLLSTLFFSIQIYCDFSGYSDIAIGTAKLFGINLMTNFKSPYFSASIKEFWSRWHISLSTWLKDYVYIPLGGNRKGKLKTYRNVIITFLLSGLWHGASWHFVIWGGLHGMAQILEDVLKIRSKKSVLKTIIVFIFCSIAWVFFSTDWMGGALHIITNMLSGITRPNEYYQNGISSLGIDNITLILLPISIILLTVFDYFSLKNDVISIVSSLTKGARWAIYVAFILWMILNIPVNDATSFIYFQF